VDQGLEPRDVQRELGWYRDDSAGRSGPTCLSLHWTAARWA